MKNKNQVEQIIKRITNKYKDKKFHLFGKKPSRIAHMLKQHNNIVSSDMAILFSFVSEIARTGNKHNAYIGIHTHFGEMSSIILDLIKFNDIITYPEYHNKKGLF